VVVASFTRETEPRRVLHYSSLFAVLDVTLFDFCNSVTSFTKAIALGADAIETILGERTKTP
jgi:glycerophosphoryl diester phosphodiesterase